MNRNYLLDSLDGLKGLVFRLLPADIRESIGCAPMTTDGPWTEEEKAVLRRRLQFRDDKHRRLDVTYPERS